MAKVRVALIVGAGRSGSTLLCRLLGQHPSVFSVGELHLLWLALLREGYLCGCKDLLTDCSIWRKVLRHVFREEDRWSLAEVNRVEMLRRGVERLRYLPALFWPRLRSARFRADVSTYVSRLTSVYSAIQESTGASVIVDSSKSPLHALLLCESAEVQSTVIHLVRDPRGVAYSWGRSKKGLEWTESYGGTQSTVASSLIWLSSNIFSEALRTRAESYLLVRYRDLARSPERTVGTLLDKLGLMRPTVSYIDANTSVASLGLDHTVAGNPMRFEAGPIAIRPDEAWRDHLPAWKRLLVAGMTWPLLIRYNRGPG